MPGSCYLETIILPAKLYDWTEAGFNFYCHWKECDIMTMAERIRYLVKRHPKSRQEIAGDLHISVDSLGNYITGRRCPDADMLRTMATFRYQPTIFYV